jgi:hypothetical protein
MIDDVAAGNVGLLIIETAWGWLDRTGTVVQQVHKYIPIEAQVSMI